MGIFPSQYIFLIMKKDIESVGVVLTSICKSNSMCQKYYVLNYLVKTLPQSPYEMRLCSFKGKRAPRIKMAIILCILKCKCFGSQFSEANVISSILVKTLVWNSIIPIFSWMCTLCPLPSAALFLFFPW